MSRFFGPTGAEEKLKVRQSFDVVARRTLLFHAGMEWNLMHSRPWKAKYPLVGVAVLFALGIALQNEFHLSLKPLLLMCLAASSVWMLISWKALEPPWPVAPFVVSAGAFLSACQWIHVNSAGPNDLKNLVLRAPQHLVVRGVVRSDPAVRMTEERDLSAKNAEQGSVMVRSGFQLKVSAVKFHTAWEPSSGVIQVRVKDRAERKGSSEIPSMEPLKGLEFGREVELEGVLSEPSPARNFGLFDFAAYLRRMGIHYEFQVDESESIRILGPASGFQWVFRARKFLAERLTLGITDDPIAAGIIRGMLLGYREDIPSDVNDAFRRTGTLHVFAISGSHISLIALALLVALRQLRVSQRWACLIVLPLLLFYVVATGLRASALRSLVMAASIILGWSLQRPSALLNNVAASALVILAWDPLQLLDAGFQLSFGVVISLVLLGPMLDQRIRGWLEPDPYIPQSCLPRWRAALLPSIQWGSAFLSVCIAAWIGSFGLNLYYFNLVSFVALLANLLIVPLASASVGLGLVSLLLGLIWDQLAITLNISQALLVHAMIGVSEGLARWRFGFFYVPQPSAEWVIAGYLLFAAALCLWIRHWRKLSMGMAAGSLAALVGLMFHAWSSDRIRIDVLDVGAGQAVLITGPHFERILIDAGSRSQGQFVVESFLRSRGVNSLDLVILTHGDAGHYGGLFQLMRSVRIGKVVLAEARFRSKGYAQLVREIEKTRIPIETWNSGDVRIRNCGLFETLWPPKDADFKRADDLGLVFRLKTPHGIVLFASDAGQKVEEALVQRYQREDRLKRTSLLVQGIHSEEDSLTESYLETVGPERLVLNTAGYPLRAYPTAELRSRVEQSGADAFYTDASGGVRAVFERGRVRIQSYFSR